MQMCLIHKSSLKFTKNFIRTASNTTKIIETPAHEVTQDVESRGVAGGRSIMQTKSTQGFDLVPSSIIVSLFCAL